MTSIFILWGGVAAFATIVGILDLLGRHQDRKRARAERK